MKLNKIFLLSAILSVVSVTQEVAAVPMGCSESELNTWVNEGPKEGGGANDRKFLNYCGINEGLNRGIPVPPEYKVEYEGMLGWMHEHHAVIPQMTKELQLEADSKIVADMKAHSMGKKESIEEIRRQEEEDAKAIADLRTEFEEAIKNIKKDYHDPAMPGAPTIAETQAAMRTYNKLLDLQAKWKPATAKKGASRKTKVALKNRNAENKAKANKTVTDMAVTLKDKFGVTVNPDKKPFTEEQIRDVKAPAANQNAFVMPGAGVVNPSTLPTGLIVSPGVGVVAGTVAGAGAAGAGAPVAVSPGVGQVGVVRQLSL